MSLNIGVASNFWLLPGINTEEIDGWYTLPGLTTENGEPLTYPKLSPDQLGRVFKEISMARQKYLANTSTQELIDLIALARDRWLDYSYSFRQKANQILPKVTGYGPEMIRRGLDDYLSLFKRDNLKTLIRAELGDLYVLDRFQERRIVPGKSRAFGPEIIMHVFSGNVPGLAAQSLITALLLKSGSFGKLAAGEPIFATLFARSLIELEPKLDGCFAFTWWPGGENLELEEVAFKSAGAVIAYGSEKAVNSIAKRLPSETRFVGYGHRLSFGVIGREVLQSVQKARQLASRAAYDVSKFDQQGCVSPHLFYVEENGQVSPREWAELLSSELKRVGVNLPRGELSPGEIAAVAALRRDYEFRSSLDAEQAMLFYAGNGLKDFATVAFDTDPTFIPSCLNRTVLVKPISNAEDIISLVKPVKAYLQTAALALEPERRDKLASGLGRMGVTRICPVGKMPDPDLAWHHDGRFNLLDLVYWTDLEEGYPL